MSEELTQAVSARQRGLWLSSPAGRWHWAAHNSWAGLAYSWNNNFGCAVGGTAGTVLCVYLFGNGAPAAAPAMTGLGN